MTTMASEISEREKEERKAYADGLREVADWIESTDADLTGLMFCPITFNLFAWNKEKFDEQSSAVGGFREKVLDGSYAVTRRWFGPHKVEVNIQREQVCERVQVGVVTVPAQEAVPEHEEPQYEWRCEGFTVTT